MGPMFWFYGIFAILVVLFALGIFFRWSKVLGPSAVAPLVQAKRRFHMQRERLEAKFLQLAAEKAPPDAPRWADCMFADDVAYARNRATGELSAFVAVTLAPEDLDPDLPAGAADHLQAGTAVFRFDRDHWETDGRAILNLTPLEAIHHFRNELKIVGNELARQT
jgi:hypothetical protein